MRTTIINQTKVTIAGEITDDEVGIYLKALQLKQKRKIIAMHVNVDGEYVDINYTLERVDFERIRRITGYLVGNTKRWNNAKISEERDRVKHG